MRWMLFAVATLALGLVPARGLAEESIPFTVVDGGLVEIPGSLGGGPPVPLLVDLGAGVNVIPAADAARLHVVPGGHYTAWRMSGQRVDFSLGTLSSISIGSLRFDTPQVALWDGLDGKGIAGLISATAFRNGAVTFDFRNNVLTLEDAGSLARRKRDGVKAALVLDDDRGISLDLFARFAFANGVAGLCEIDTGSQGYFLDRRYAGDLGIDVQASKRVKIGGSGVDGYAAPIPTLALHDAGAVAAARPRAIFTNLIYDCNVGNDFWKGRVVTFDIPGHALYVGR